MFETHLYRRPSSTRPELNSFDRQIFPPVLPHNTLKQADERCFVLRVQVTEEFVIALINQLSKDWRDLPSRRAELNSLKSPIVTGAGTHEQLISTKPLNNPGYRDVKTLASFACAVPRSSGGN
jgi:hypothetical protein